MTNLDSIFKSRDITLPTKVHLVKAMVFPVVKNGCESWTVKKAEHRRIDAFELWCWRRHLRVPWIAKRSNLSILGLWLPWASVRNSAHGKGHEEGGFRIHKGGIEPQETFHSRASTPKTRVCFMLSPIPLTLWGAVPPPPLSEKELICSSS